MRVVKEPIAKPAFLAGYLFVESFGGVLIPGRSRLDAILLGLAAPCPELALALLDRRRSAEDRTGFPAWSTKVSVMTLSGRW